jgi:hypothetical protein
MRPAALGALVVAFSAAAVAGCTSQPVYNVKHAPIVTADGKPATLTEAEKAIERAGAALGWQIYAARPGLTVATHRARNYTAVVDVTYDERSFSITYSNSANLSYDGANIHPTYNDLVQRLETSIRAQLRAL